MELPGWLFVRSFKEDLRMSMHLSAEDLSAYLDGEQDLAEAGHAHLRECAECGRLHREALELRRMARETSPAVPTDAMWEAIRSRIGEAEEDAPRKPRWNMRMGLALGGAMAAAVATVVMFKAPVERRVPGETAATGTPPPPAAEPVQAPAPRPETKAARKPKKAPALAEARDDAAEPAAANAPSVDAAPASRAPAENAEAPSARAATAAERPSFRGALFVLKADRLATPERGRTLATGRVVVAPRTPGVPYFATVDGMTRTLTGAVAGVSAEILSPGDRLSIKTR